MNTDSAESVTTQNTVSPPRWFWVVAIVALLWFLMDMSAFFMRVFSGDPTDTLSNAQKFPLWVNLVFACEVFGGTLGCVALLLKRKWALVVFVISLLGVLSQTTYIYLLSDAIARMGSPAVIMPLVSVAIGIGMIVLAKSATSKRWLI